jgi:hypothetical protein
MTDKDFDSWSKWSDGDYPEKYCHFSGEESLVKLLLISLFLKRIG